MERINKDLLSHISLFIHLLIRSVSLSPLASRSLRLRLRSRSARSARSCLRRVMSEKSEGEDMKRATRVKFLPARLTRLRGEQTIRLRLMVKGLGNNPLDTAGIRSQVQTAHVLVTPSPSSIHYEPPKGENGENDRTGGSEWREDGESRGVSRCFACCPSTGHYTRPAARHVVPHVTLLLTA